MTTEKTRRARTGTVDFSLMYFAHDAFERDLDRLTAAVAAGRANDPAVVNGWETFKRQLHIHHTAEDEALWPLVREKATGSDVDILDAMEEEHSRIDPLLDRVDAVRNDADAVEELVTALSSHLEHEEEEALPLIERTIGPEGWAAFGREMRRRSGFKGAAEYFPWLLDGAPEETKKAMLGMLPPPVRLLYRGVWLRGYSRTPRWSAA